MSGKFDEKIYNLPIINSLVNFSKKIMLPGLSELSLFDVLEMYFFGIVKGAINMRAAGIAFSFLTAIFPFLIFILTLIKYIPIEGFQEDFLFLINQWLPPTTYKIAHDQVINYIMNHNYGGLVSFYFLLSLFFMSNGVSAIFGGFQNSYHIKTSRSLIKFYAVSILVSFLLVLYLILTVAVNFYFQVIIEKLKETGIVNSGINWYQISRNIFFIAVIFVSVSTLFYFGTKESKEFKFVSAGSIMTTLLIIMMTYFFGIYIVRFSKYNELYGSIGSLLIFMLYIWLISILLLLGFELNASLYQIKKLKNNNLTQ
jgi:membrane protein